MRVVGIVRQSKGRDESLSPAEQRDRIAEACERDGLELSVVYEEIDVSGGTPLDKREALRGAVEAVEAGEAEVVMVAYFDRLVRSLRVQDEVVSRVEAAGGRVVAVDFGDVTGRTAAQWLSGTMIGAVSEYYRRSVKERSGEAQAKAVANGVVPWPTIPPGYSRGEDGALVPDELAPVAVRAFEMRAAGETVKSIRSYLRDNDIDRSYHGVSSMLRSRLYLGEIHFGSLVNLHAHEPLIDRDLWQQAQAPVRGPRIRSERLLARLGVLRCGTCGARMVVGTQRQNGRSYPFYRCPSTGDCPERMAISARIVEEKVVAAVRERLADIEESASADSRAREAEANAERAQADLDAAIRAFTGLEDEPVAQSRLADLRAKRDEARAIAHELGSLRSALTISAGADWERLTLDEQRALIQATVARVLIAPGRGSDRISLEFVA